MPLWQLEPVPQRDRMINGMGSKTELEGQTHKFALEARKQGNMETRIQGGKPLHRDSIVNRSLLTDR